MEFDHVTAFVPDADAAAAALERLFGEKPVAALALPGMAIRTFRFGDGEIHVNAPTGPGVVEDHLRRHGAGYHHIALRVPDLDASLRELAHRGLTAMGTPVETAPGLREVFLDPATTGGLLIQIVERPPKHVRPGDFDTSAVAALAEQSRVDR